MTGLDKLRLQALMTRLEVSRRIGVSRQTFSLWANGRSVPTLDHIKKLTEVLGVDVAALLAALEDTGQKRVAA